MIATNEAAVSTSSFASFVELRDEHDRMMATGDSLDSQVIDLWIDCHRFIERACATGSLLDDPQERLNAQRMITYWTNALCRANQPPPSKTLLDPFDASLKRELPDDLHPYVTPDDASSPEALRHLAGWSRLIRECLDRLKENRLVAVVGPPHSGRSTLLTHGVVPALKDLEGGRDRIVIGPVALSAYPIRHLTRRIAEKLGLKTPDGKAREEMRSDSKKICAMLDPPSPPVVLFIDRFEELLASPKRADVNAVVAAVAQIHRAGRHQIILTLASDAVNQLATFESELAAAVNAGRVHFTFDTKELRQAIEEPAKRVGLRFDPGVVDRLLADVQGDPFVAPLLQFSLARLWKERDGDRITAETYRKQGGGRTALRRAADEVFRQLRSKGLEDVARKVFVTLVPPQLGDGYASIPASTATPTGSVATNGEDSGSNGNYPTPPYDEGPGSTDGHPAVEGAIGFDAGGETSSGYVPRSAFDDAGERQRVDEVLTRLVEARLVASEFVEDQKEPWFNLTFSALSQVWPPLRGWLSDEAFIRRERAKLRAAAETWRDSKERDKQLWGRLDVELARNRFNFLSDLETAFLDRSEAREKRVRHTRIAAWTSVAVAVLVGLWGWDHLVDKKRDAESAAQIAITQKESAEKAKRAAETVANLKTKIAARMSIDAAQARIDQLDSGGAVLQYLGARNANAYASQASEAARDPNASDQRRSVDDIDMPMGVAWRTLPKLTGLIAGAPLFDVVFSVNSEGRPDGRWGAQIVDLLIDKVAACSVVIWDLRNDKQIGKALQHDRPVNLASARRVGGDEYLLTAGAWRASTDTSARPGGEAAVKDDRVQITLWSRKTDDTQNFAPRGKVLLKASGRVTQAELSPDAAAAAVVVVEEREKGGSPTTSLWLVKLTDQEWTPKELPILDNGEKSATTVVVNHIAFQPAPCKMFGVAMTKTSNEVPKGDVRLWSHPEARPISIDHVAGQNGEKSSPSPILPPALHLAFSPDGKWLAAGCGPREEFAPGRVGATEGSAKLWKVGEARTSLSPPRTIRLPAPALFVAFNGASDRALVCANNGDVGLWSLDSIPRELRKLENKSIVVSADFSPDGARIATVGRDRTARIWNVHTGEQALPTIHHSGAVRHARFTEDGHSLVTTCKGNLSLAADTDSPANARAREVLTGQVWSLRGDEDEGERRVSKSGALKYAALTPNGLIAASRSGDHANLSFFKTDPVELKGTPESTIAKSSLKPVDFAAADPQGSRVVAVGGDRATLYLDEGPIDLPKFAPPKYACFSADGKLLVTVGGNQQRNGSVSFWDASNGKPLDARKVPASARPFNFTAASPKGSKIAWVVATCGSQNPSSGRDVSKEPWAYLWRSDSLGEEPLALPEGHTERVTFAAFSPDGQLLVTCSDDNSACVWRLHDRTDSPIQLVHKLMKHSANVRLAAFSPDGTRILTAAYDRTAVLWDWNQKVSKAVIFDHGDRINALAFSSDGRRALTAGRDGRCCIWNCSAASPDGGDTVQAQRRLVVLRHSREVLAATFNADGTRVRTVVSGSAAPDGDRDASGAAGDGVLIKEWNLNPVDGIERLAPLMAQRKLDEATGELKALTINELKELWDGRNKN
jgi:WD40 repeat protein